MSKLLDDKVKKIVDRILLVAILVLIATLIAIYYLVKSEQTKCIYDSFSYGAKAYYAQTHASLSCTCITNDSFFGGFMFDQTGNKTPIGIPVRRYG